MKCINKIRSFAAKALIVPLVLALMLPLCVSAEPELGKEAKSVILIEASTGKVLYENNADERLPPASVTKIMTLLLAMEAIDSGTIKLTDMVQVSSNAASMGGSQVFLEPGEEMSVDELIKCVAVASANDAAVALGEFIAGSEEGFVERMNVRAKELDMTNTHFENATGLDDNVTDHLTTARDIAIMSRELMSHETILNYTTIWMDSIRNGEFGLTNTNRLIRFYSGANGLKTGSTSKALFCISAAAKRDNMQLIAVIMGAPTRDVRNEIAKKLLDYGFANYKYVEYEEGSIGSIPVIGGVKNECNLRKNGFNAVLQKNSAAITEELILPEYVSAPICEGEVIGEIQYVSNGEVIGKADVIAVENVEKISYFGLLYRLVRSFFLCG